MYELQNLLQALTWLVQALSLKHMLGSSIEFTQAYVS